MPCASLDASFMLQIWRQHTSLSKHRTGGRSWHACSALTSSPLLSGVNSC